MLSTKTIGLIFSALLLAAGQADARSPWLERDGRYVLAPRRTGQEHPAAIDQISAACNTGVCATLAGQAISTLLAAAQECTQQDAADNMITVAKTFTDATESAALTAGAIAFRQAEKNVQPDFTTNPVTGVNSVFCQKAPVNAELNGLVQAQDPANDPTLFFDPLNKKIIKAGDRPNTSPFGTTAVVAVAATTDAAAETATATAVETAAATAVETSAAAVETGVAATATACAAQVTVTVTAQAAAATTVAAAVTTAPAAVSTTEVAAASATTAAVASGTNLQTFTGAIGGIVAPSVVTGGRGFQVEGNASFPALSNALTRSCDVQGNKCHNAANAQTAGVDFDACTVQQTACDAAQ